MNGCHTQPVGDEPARPELATVGLLCGRCASRLETWLSEIPADYALLPWLAEPTLSQHQSESKHLKDPEPPAPTSLVVVALTDRRGAGATRVAGDELWYELPDVPAVLPVVHAWAEQLRNDLDPGREDRPVEARAVTVHGECGYLLAGFDSLCAAEWVTDAYQELNVTARALRTVHGLTGAKPLGRCLLVECDGKVWPSRDGVAKCGTCRRRYDPTDLIRVRLTDEIIAKRR